MKRLLLVLSLVLLVGCKDATTDPVDPVDPVNCLDDEELSSDGTCVKIEEEVDYLKEVEDIYSLFLSDFKENKIGSQQLKLVVTLNGDFFEDNQKIYVVDYYTEFDLIEERIYLEQTSTLSNDVDIYGNVTKKETGYEFYINDNGVETTNPYVFTGTFEEHFYDNFSLPFDIDFEDSFITVTSPSFHLYRILIEKDHLDTATGGYLEQYLTDFTNPTVSVELTYNQLDNELVFTVDIDNSDSNGKYESIEVVYTIKILDELYID